MNRLPGERTLARSGLMHLWAARHPFVAAPGAQRLAARHVTESLRSLGALPRMAVTAALVVLGLLSGGSWPADDPRPARRVERLARVPGVAQLVRVTTTLALLGALDGTSAGTAGGARAADAAGGRRG